MEYDFNKCNNLRWECGDKNNKHSGFCRVFKNNRTGEDVITFVEIINIPYGLTREYNFACMNPDDVDKDVCIKNLRIVPRDPETYEDWQVGDAVVEGRDGETLEIGARIDNIVFTFEPDTGEANAMWTCHELFAQGFRLVLTDYEMEIAEAEKKSEYPFKDGDRVLLRLSSSDTWKLGRFNSADYNPEFPNMVCSAGRYTQCIPYNEKTWRLLGTTGNYKEDDDDNLGA